MKQRVLNTEAHKEHLRAFSLTYLMCITEPGVNVASDKMVSILLFLRKINPQSSLKKVKLTNLQMNKNVQNVRLCHELLLNSMDSNVQHGDM